MNEADLIEKILIEAPRVAINGETHYVVENDRLLSESQVEKYAREMVCLFDDKCSEGGGERLVVATDGNRMMKWETPTVLTWAIDNASFIGHCDWLKAARSICEAATEDWNEAARQQGVLDHIRFAPAPENSNAAFTFCYNDFADSPGLLALAFFPNAQPNERVVYIGPGTFSDAIPYDKIGIIRHELGHVLGFRHEHIRDEAQVGMTAAQKAKMEQWVTGDIGGQIIAEFDGQSVMHYPIKPSAGLGNYTFELSKLDREGFGALYSRENTDPEVKVFRLSE